ncbi:MAG: aminoglycoside phosphotransferase family protein [Pyrinomonadaceae bacterium]
MSDHQTRLEQYLTLRNEPLSFKQLTADASTREYFRINWHGKHAIACVYPEAFIAAEQSYLDVTKLFKAGGLPVANILDFDEELGVIVQEDFGDTILRDVLQRSQPQEKEALIDEAIKLIAKIQKTTELAYDTGSIASRLKFDTEKLMWELEFFREHYFETYLKKPLTEAETAALQTEFLELVRELESRACVLCHRDFHAANLMVDGANQLRIIDHQDARIGSPAYDLVSLLLDRITQPPSSSWLAVKRKFLLAERVRLGLSPLDEAEFTNEFRLQTIQRCLKAAGTFSYQSAMRGKTYFIPFIKPMFEIVLRAVENLGRFDNLRKVMTIELDK